MSGDAADIEAPGAEAEAPGASRAEAFAQDSAEVALVEALRRGDEAAFAGLVDRYHDLMLRVAAMYVPSRTVAEEVVQETWLAVIKGLDRFEGRSTLKTWMFRILVNRARTRGVREGRSVPFSALWLDGAPAEAAVDPRRFGPNRAGLVHWTSPPKSWPETPDARLLAEETLDVVRAAIEQLPASQKAVITLRDLDGWSAQEVCDLLHITDANQRVLLHRARTKVRRALERAFA